MYKRYYRQYGTNEQPPNERVNEKTDAAEDANQNEPEQVQGVRLQDTGSGATASLGSSFGGFDCFFKRFKVDDILLLVLIFILLQDTMTDDILLIVLAFLFISGIN